jgi:hypothetical protein
MAMTVHEDDTERIGTDGGKYGPDSFPASDPPSSWWGGRGDGPVHLTPLPVPAASEEPAGEVSLPQG